MSVVISDRLAANVIHQICQVMEDMDGGNQFRAGYELGRLHEAFANAMFGPKDKEESE